MSDPDLTGTAVLAREAAPAWDLFAPRFPIARRGYDRDAVDEYIAKLEQELADLRGGGDPSGAVQAEIERIGEQTVAILRVAHEQASDTVHRAQEEADRCLSAAASNAVAMTEEAKAQLQRLDSETDAIWRERARLLEDVRALAGSLSSLADDALERFPPEPDRVASAGSPTVALGPIDGDEGPVDAETAIRDAPSTELEPDD
jgi:DivIVA domain-containing protein